jgi:hypothetical protein
MKIKLILLPSILILAPTAFLLFTHQERAFGQNAPPEAKRRTLPNQGAVSKMRVDDRVVPKPKVGMVSQPDLTIKTMCIEHNKYGNSLDILIANTGSSDAGFFELGITYFFEGGGETQAIEPISGLKAGEEKWLGYVHVLLFDWGGRAVDTSVRIQVIADPKYWGQNHASNSWDPKNYSWHMPRILESNEKNNELTLNKSELKHCAFKVEQQKAPPVAPLKP